MMPRKTKQYVSRTRVVQCPKCKAEFIFRRKAAAYFDQHGFESHRLCCKHCHAFMTGIIDPFDGALLVSAE